jgi:acetyltransferase-like isoleucine patch superfamily enzyme
MQNQFRKHFKPSILDHINTLYYRFIGVNIGKKSFIQWNAKIERFHKSIYIGDNTIIKPYTRLCCCNKKSEIHIKNNVSIGHFTFIYASNYIEIGNNCMIAPFNYFVDSNHRTSIEKNLMDQENVVDTIIIENDCWIGQNSTILPGSRMKEGAILGAKSLLNIEINKNEIYAGIPAKKISLRK